MSCNLLLAFLSTVSYNFSYEFSYKNFTESVDLEIRVSELI